MSIQLPELVIGDMLTPRTAQVSVTAVKVSVLFGCLCLRLFFLRLINVSSQNKIIPKSVVLRVTQCTVYFQFKAH